MHPQEILAQRRQPLVLGGGLKGVSDLGRIPPSHLHHLRRRRQPQQQQQRIMFLSDRPRKCLDWQCNNMV